jgi:hypothetical protein
LEENSEEWDAVYYESWKEDLEGKYSIYLYDSAMPINVKLDEIDNHIFYCYNHGDIVVDENNNIYVNRNADIKKALSSLISNDENEFSTEDLLLLYQTKETVHAGNDQVAELINEVERLRKRVAELEGVSGRTSYDATVSYDDSYHDELKEKSEKYLFGILNKLYPKHTVNWLNLNKTKNSFVESWANHDFEILDKNGAVMHYIDCKGTPKNKRTFYLTKNEWDFFIESVQNGESYQIYRIFNVDGAMNYTQIDNLLEWIETGKVVPYLTATETIKGGRVFLTLT